MKVLGQAFDKGLVDAVHFYVAPLLMGGPTVAVGGSGVASVAAAYRVTSPIYTRIGDDIFVEGEVEVLRS